MSDRDQLFHDIFVTAIEGGVNYWASVKEYHWMNPDESEDHDGFHATLLDEEDWDRDDLHVTRRVIARGYRLAVGEWRNRLGWSSEKPPVVVGEDGWDFDAGDADMIVQLGLFGTVIYG